MASNNATDGHGARQALNLDLSRIERLRSPDPRTPLTVLVLPCATIFYIVFFRARLRTTTEHTVVCLSQRSLHARSEVSRHDTEVAGYLNDSGYGELNAVPLLYGKPDGPDPNEAIATNAAGTA